MGAQVCSVCGKQEATLCVFTREVKPMRTSLGSVYRRYESCSEVKTLCAEHRMPSRLALDITAQEEVALVEAAKVSQEAFDANWAEIEARLNTLPNKYRAEV